MDTYEFKAIGTTWSVSVDGEKLLTDTKQEIATKVELFENQFSRFLPDSEVNSFKSAQPGTYQISKEFLRLLERADRLRKLTDGVYDPAVAELLERTGYDNTYSFKENKVENFSLPSWSLDDDKLVIGGPVSFDLGGIGKGYCIDLVATILMSYTHIHFIVEAGGDMYGTTKKDNTAWNIAIEYPGRPDEAYAFISLNHTAVAVSDTMRRRWGKWHHVLNPLSKTAVEHVLGASAVAKTAWDADSMTSVLFLGDEKKYKAAAEELNAAYVVLYANGACLKSNNWPGKVFQ